MAQKEEKKKDTAETLSVAGREVRVTSPGKPYFTREAKLSKLDVVRYYLSVAEGALAESAIAPSSSSASSTAPRASRFIRSGRPTIAPTGCAR